MNDLALASLSDYRAVFEAAPDLYLVLTPDLMIAGASAAFCRATRTERPAIVGRHLFDAFPDNPEDATAVAGTAVLRASLARALESGLPDKMPTVKYDVRSDESAGGGFEERYWAAVNVPVLNPAGDVRWLIHRVEDMTAEVQRESREAARYADAERQGNIIAQLQATGRFLETLIESLPGMLVVKSLPDYRYVLLNRAAEEIFGLHRGAVLGKTVYDFFPKEEADGFDARDRAVIESGIPVRAEDDRITTRTRDVRLMQTTKIPVAGPDGKPKYLLGVYHDVTDARTLEQQLRQAMKMEAVGQLTGGVAHDFNNLLGIIIGNLDIALDRATADPALREGLDAALQASLRGAELTRRLLAFSRKQPLRPEIVDLNRGLPDIANMLRRTLGEQITVELHPGSGLWLGMVDRAQIDETILNLAINARDAMPGGGKLSIETANVVLDEAYAAHNSQVTPGEYVQLSVSDNGTGMTPEVIEHCFDPFFTTKDVEKGSGLGLSMVYGFVKQSGGHIKVYSEVGHGTSVKIYLPRADRVELSAPPVNAAEIAAQPGSEWVLVVEDNAELRKVTIKQLTSLGYRTLEAENAKLALDLLARHAEIDLLFSDIIMPGGMTGVELARAARQLYPDLKLLLVSGYAARASLNGFDDIKDIDFLSKPFRKRDLAQKIRHVLDESDRVPL